MSRPQTPSNRHVHNGLTIREKQVVEAYDGFTPYREIGAKLGITGENVSVIMCRPHVIKAIQEREVTNEIFKPLIASREELQVFWTTIMRDEENGLKDRMKASEYLGKSFGMFVEKIEQKNTVSFEDMLKALDKRAEDNFDDL